MTHSQIIDIYDLKSFSEFTDYETIKFVVDRDSWGKKDTGDIWENNNKDNKDNKIDIYVNDINYNYKPSENKLNTRAYSDYCSGDILDHFDRCIFSKNILVKIKTNMNSKMLTINQSSNDLNIIYNNKTFYCDNFFEIRFYKLNIKRFFEKNDIKQLYIEFYIKNGPSKCCYSYYDNQCLIRDYKVIRLRNYTQFFKIQTDYYLEKPTKNSLKKINTFSIPIYTDNKLKQKHTLIVDYFHINKDDPGIYILNSFKNEISGEIIPLNQKNHCTCTNRSYIKCSQIKDNTNIQDAISICYCFYENITHQLHKTGNLLYINFDDIKNIFKLRDTAAIEIIDVCR